MFFELGLHDKVYPFTYPFIGCNQFYEYCIYDFVNVFDLMVYVGY